MRRRAILAVFVLLAACASPSLRSPPSFPPDAQVRALLERIVGCDGELGIVVGLMEADSPPRVIACGGTGVGNARADADSVFEIGSLTKVFTGVLLADMVARGEVRLDDPLTAYVPSTVRVPGRPWRPITLLDLATHTAGLPRDPTNLPNTARTYARYTVDELYAFLSTYELTRDPGVTDEYSNLFALVGHALANKAGRPYEALLRERVLDPLGLARTAVSIAKDTAGHDDLGDERPDFVVPALEPAVGLRSTANELLRFAAANMEGGDRPIDRAMREARMPRRPMARTGRYWGLGWAVEPHGAAVGHQGSTFGYTSYLHVDPQARRAIVVLANFTGGDVGAIGGWLLDPSHHAHPLPSVRREVYRTWQRGGVTAALDRYRELGGGNEQDLNTVAYRILVQRKADDAIALFAFNASRFPESANVYDSLAEAYLLAGRIPEAVANCTRAVEIAEREHDSRLEPYRRLCAAVKDKAGQGPG